MDLPMKGELRRVFNLATLRQEARQLRSGRQWEQAKTLMMRANVLRAAEQDAFKTRYETRVEVARRRLIDEASGRSKDFKPISGAVDRFSPSALLRQAQREVRSRHEHRLLKIDEIETRSLMMIVRQAERENAIHGKAREAFSRSAGPLQSLSSRRQTGPPRS